jgi:hypothetical protein
MMVAHLRAAVLSDEHAAMDQFAINADMLRVNSDFAVNLTDYGIRIVAPLRLKVSNSFNVRISLTAFHR